MKRVYMLRMERRPSKSVLYMLKDYPDFILENYYGSWITYHGSYKEAREVAKLFAGLHDRDYWNTPYGVSNVDDYDILYPHFKIRKLYVKGEK